MGHPEIHWKGFFLGGNIRKPMIFKQEVIELIFSNSQDTHTHRSWVAPPSRSSHHQDHYILVKDPHQP